MLRFTPLPLRERSRMRARRGLFLRHGAEATPEGRSLGLLRHWLSPVQAAQFAEKGYFEVVGGDTGKRYRIYAGAATNVCEVDEKGRKKVGLCFRPIGELPIGDVMLWRARGGQKIRSERFHVQEKSVFSLIREGGSIRNNCPVGVMRLVRVIPSCKLGRPLGGSNPRHS